MKTNFPRLAEYREVKAMGAPWASVETIDSAQMRIGYSSLFTTVRLVRSTPGYEPAGSMARWTDGYWGVRYELDNAIHGHRFNLESGHADALARFNRLAATAAEQTAA